jgi:hypothetical protein
VSPETTRVLSLSRRRRRSAGGAGRAIERSADGLGRQRERSGTRAIERRWRKNDFGGHEHDPDRTVGAGRVPAGESSATRDARAAGSRGRMRGAPARRAAHRTPLRSPHVKLGEQQDGDGDETKKRARACHGGDSTRRAEAARSGRPFGAPRLPAGERADKGCAGRPRTTVVAPRPRRATDPRTRARCPASSPAWAVRR